MMSGLSLTPVGGVSGALGVDPAADFLSHAVHWAWELDAAGGLSWLVAYSPPPLRSLNPNLPPSPATTDGVEAGARLVRLLLMNAADPRGSVDTRYEHASAGAGAHTQILRLKGWQVCDAAGVVLGTRGVAWDVTAEWAEGVQQQQMQRLEVMATFAAGVSHDVNNILGSLVGGLALLREELEAGEKAPLATELLDAMESTLLRGQGIMHDLVTSVRYDRSTDPAPALQDSQPEQTLADLVDRVRRLVPPDVRFRADLQPVGRPLTLSRGQLQQVVLNVVDNALYALRLQAQVPGPADGSALELRLGASVLRVTGTHPMLPTLAPGDYLELSVYDTGPGMDLETMRRICDPFFTTRPVGQGQGLGLSVVLGLVKSVGGGLFVTSDLGTEHYTELRVLVPLGGNAGRWRGDVVPPPEPAAA